mmetsp:Transcript_7522/g.7592  ORF Transcript_7522/g.7592 Transcript_7522/m.7592 type:complete len:374 (+) Transcript_7522:133-1254(+)
MGSGASINSLQKQVTHLNLSKTLITSVRDDCLELSDKGMSDEEIQHMLKTSYSNIIDNSGNIIEMLFAEITVGRLNDVESRTRCRQSCIKLFEKGLDDSETLILLKMQFKNLVDSRYEIIEKIQTEVKCRQECIKLFEQGTDEDEILNTLKIEYQDTVGSMEKISMVFTEIQYLRTLEKTETATDYGGSRRPSDIESVSIKEMSFNASSKIVSQSITSMKNNSNDSTLETVKQPSKLAKQPSKMGLILETSMLRPMMEKALSIMKPIIPKISYQGVVAKVNTQNDSEVKRKKSSGIRRGSTTDSKSYNHAVNSIHNHSMNNIHSIPSDPIRRSSISRPRRRNSLDSQPQKKIVHEDITYFKDSFLNSQQGPLG